MCSKGLLVAALGVLFSTAGLAADNCHPEPDLGKPQYIVGYGSLMETASKERTDPGAGANLPIRVKGFQRRWNATGSSVGFSTTYLGVAVVEKSSMNATVYRLFKKDAIAAADEREAYYCRDKVAPTQIIMLDKSEVPQGEIWIYVNKKENDQAPSSSYPIVQSYVDIFLSGCFELQDRFGLNDFAAECISSTVGWSGHWINDRLYPRRPFIYQSNAGRIDQLLSQKLPEYFKQIRIE